MRGERVYSLKHLYKLRSEHKAVETTFHCMKIKPAAFIINLSGEIIYQMFRSGMYVFHKDPK